MEQVASSGIPPVALSTPIELEQANKVGVFQSINTKILIALLILFSLVIAAVIIFFNLKY